MTAFLLVFCGSVLLELSTSLGKYEIKHKKESLYAFGFLSGVWSLIILLVTGLFVRDEFVFSLASLPTFSLRAILEVGLMYLTLQAISVADRSTYSFLRILTIPLLLLVDITLGYSISTYQLIGIAVVITTVLLLTFHHDLSKKGKLLCLASASLAVTTISLYKYNITHFNSVEAEQSLILLINLSVLALTARMQGHENIFVNFTRPLYLVQSLAMGAAGTLISFAYLFAPASIIVTVERSLGVLASIISGRLYFHEKNLYLKLIAGVAIIVGIALATVQL